MNDLQVGAHVLPPEQATAILQIRAVGTHLYVLITAVPMIRTAYILKVLVTQVLLVLIAFGIRFCTFVSMEAGVRRV